MLMAKMTTTTVVTPKTWEESRTACSTEMDGARLTVVNNQKSFEALQTLFPEPEKYWLGGSDRDSENHWYWTDENGRKENFVFTKWGAQEPNGNTGENCLARRFHDWKWVDRACESKLGFCCQVSPSGESKQCYLDVTIHEFKPNEKTK